VNRWLLQCNPAVWDIHAWRADGNEGLSEWIVGRHFDDLSVGDPFALWVGGKQAGVYAVGQLTGEARPSPRKKDGDYWKKTPNRDTWVVPLRVDVWLEEPIPKRELASDPDFAKATILRTPFAANPFRLSFFEWGAIERHLPVAREGAGSDPRSN